MRRLSYAVTLATLVLLGAGGVLFLRTRVARPLIGQRFVTSAMFRDGSGLPSGSQVVIAGVRVGEIDGLAIQDGLARVSMRLRDDVVIWDDAWAAKRATSLLGDSFIEILPGGPLDDGPVDAARHRLKSGDPILHVLEGGSTERVLRSINNTMPRVDSAMIAADRFLVDARRWVSGPFTDGWQRADRWLGTGAIAGPIDTVAASAARLDEWTATAAESTAGLAQRILPGLDEANEQIVGATEAVVTAEVTIRDTLGTARKRMDSIDPYLARANAVLAEYAGQTPAEDQGTLARLINDEDLADRIAGGTETVKDFTTGLDRTKLWLGLRGEFNVLSGKPRVYVIAEVNTRSDSFYLIEAEKGSLGRYPKTTLTDQPGSDMWTLRSEIDDGIRFSLQWGKRLGRARFRFGIKESTFGAGADLDLLPRNRLRLSADVFDAQFANLPRVKLAASLEIFKFIYITAGIDDALNPGRDLPIAAWPAGQDVPMVFDEYHVGRDYFFGAMVNISDADLATMLRIYGALLLSGIAPGP